MDFLLLSLKWTQASSCCKCYVSRDEFNHVQPGCCIGNMHNVHRAKMIWFYAEVSPILRSFNNLWLSFRIEFIVARENLNFLQKTADNLRLIRAWLGLAVKNTLLRSIRLVLNLFTNCRSCQQTINIGIALEFAFAFEYKTLNRRMLARFRCLPVNNNNNNNNIRQFCMQTWSRNKVSCCWP